MSDGGLWEAAVKRIAGMMALVACLTSSSVRGGDIEYPQLIRTRYEAADPKTGGNFIIWSERERIFYGLDPKLYPAAKYVDITQVTPTSGSITLTFIEVKTLSGQTSDYLYLTGNVRFRVSGMVLKSSNFPSGGGMTP
jgi:hypothetical protein